MLSISLERWSQSGLLAGRNCRQLVDCVGWKSSSDSCRHAGLGGAFARERVVHHLLRRRNPRCLLQRISLEMLVLLVLVALVSVMHFLLVVGLTGENPRGR